MSDTIRGTDPIRLFKVSMDTEDAIDRLCSVFDSGYIGQGPKVDQFEEELTTLLGSERRVITTNSCTSALELAFRMIGVRDGYVISTPQTCTATNTAILAAGGTILWADVDQFSGNIDPQSVKKILESYQPGLVKAIACVDWSGSSCDYDALRAVCHPRNIPIVEDAAHSLLTRYNGEPIANAGGDYVCWSFQAIKHLTTGDGGALVVPAGQEKRAELLRWYGLDRTSSASFRCTQGIKEAGFKFHMNDIAASIGLANIKDVPWNVMKCKANAKQLSERLKMGNGVLYVPTYDPNSSYWLFTILVKRRDTFLEYMKGKRIDTSPVHARNDKHPCLPEQCSDPKFRQGIDYFSERQVSIPCGWWLSPQDLDEIVEAVNGWNDAL